jgi:hypothetical protein
MLKIPYKFKKSYGLAPKPQTAQYAPWLHGLSLKNLDRFFPFLGLLFLKQNLLFYYIYY